MLRKKLNLSTAEHSPVPHKKQRLSDKVSPELLEVSAETVNQRDKSKYFSTTEEFQQKYLNIQLELNSCLQKLNFSDPVKYKYNPVEYAFKGNECYVKKYCNGPKKLLFVGMNPGPFGMCQTGVPFGDVNMVKNWLQIETEINKPPNECPNRKIMGFECPRGEVSGNRLWGLFQKLSKSPNNFFRNCFVFNYCPLAFMDTRGCNVTPRDMKGKQKELEQVCDQFFAKIVELIEPEIVIGIGEYAEKRCQSVANQISKNFTILRLPHPSPRSPKNNNWSEKAEKFFKDNNLLQYIEWN